MSEFIEKQAAIDAIEEIDWYHQNKNKDMVSGANSSEHQAWYKADDIYKTLEALPSAEAIPVEWIEKWIAGEYCKQHLGTAKTYVWEMLEDWKNENKDG